MKRTFILEQIKKQLLSADLRGPVGEIRIIALSDRAKGRSLYLAECTEAQLTERADAIRVYLDDEYAHHYHCEQFWSASIDAMIADVHPALDENVISNNWRCRLMRPAQLDVTTPERINELAMGTTWRVFIVQDTRGFFVRHDIYPAIWFPGFSVAGFPQYEDSLRSNLNGIARDNGILVDQNFDIVKLFAKNMESNHYHQLGAAVPVSHLIDDFEGVNRTFLESARVYFNQGLQQPNFWQRQIQQPAQQIHQTTIQSASGTSYAIINVGGVQMTGAPCPGDPNDYDYNPVTNAWLLKRR